MMGKGKIALLLLALVFSSGAAFAETDCTGLGESCSGGGFGGCCVPGICIGGTCEAGYFCGNVGQACTNELPDGGPIYNGCCGQVGGYTECENGLCDWVSGEPECTVHMGWCNNIPGDVCCSIDDICRVVPQNDLVLCAVHPEYDLKLLVGDAYDIIGMSIPTGASEELLIHIVQDGSQSADVSLDAQIVGGATLVPSGQMQVQVQPSSYSQEISYQVTCPGTPGTHIITLEIDSPDGIKEPNLDEYNDFGAGENVYEQDNVATVVVTCADGDLAAQNAQAVPSSALAGENVQASVEVANIGTSPSPPNTQIEVRAAVQGMPAIAAQTLNTLPLAAGESREVGFQFTCPQVTAPTQYAVNFAVDNADSIGEVDEGNNAASATFSCTPVQQGGISFAFSAAAMLLAFALLALAYMASYVFDQPHLRAIILDEVVHLLATAVVLISLVSLATALDTVYIPGLLGAAGGEVGGTLGMQAENALWEISSDISAAFNSFKGLNENLGVAASRSVYCTYLGAGYSLVACSTLNMLRGTTVQAMIVLGSALSDISIEQLLLKLSQLYAFTILMPAGLFLHAFKFTRAGGAALIAIAAGFYIVHPLTVVLFENMLMEQVESVGGEQWANSAPLVDPGVTCDPAVQDVAQLDNERAQIADSGLMDHVVFLALVRSIFATIARLMITLAFIRAFAGLLGSEIDVSALARIS